MEEKTNISNDQSKLLLEASVTSVLMTIDVICETYKDDKFALRDILSKIDERVFKLRHLLNNGARPTTAPSAVRGRSGIHDNKNMLIKTHKQEPLGNNVSMKRVTNHIEMERKSSFNETRRSSFTKLRRLSLNSVHPVEKEEKIDTANRLTMSQPSTMPQREKIKPGSKESIKIAAQEAFNIIDVNHDGFLQKDEVVAAIKMMKENGTDLVPTDDNEDITELAEKIMNDVDTDGDGQIDMNEFVDMMKRNVSRSTKNGGVSYNHRMSQLARNVLLAHQKKVENSVIGNDLWMIHPQSNFHASWDIIVSMLILLTVLTMPLSLGWEELNEEFFNMNLIVDIIFLIDVCKNFCTGFVDENDAVIMDARVVRKTYFYGFFFPDFFSSIPLDLLLRAVGISSNDGAVTTKKTLNLLRLLRFPKLFRLLRINRLFRHLKMIVLWIEVTLHIRISDGFTKLVRLGIGALVLGHWIGCFNFMLVRMYDFPADSWVVYAGLEDKDAFIQWSWSFFKALAQMIMIGFETPPFTNASCDTASHWCGIEHWITLVCLYLGAVFYSLLISSISSILQTANLASRQFEEKLMQIDDYMRNKRLPAVMREKVKDYFHLQHANGKLYNENEILDLLTPVLRREVKLFNGRDLAIKVPMLSSVTNKDFAEEMTTAIEPVLAFKNETIFRENTTGDEMYFINSGVIEIFVAAARSSTYVAIGDGCYFGEVSLLLDVKRTASARTKTQCSLYKIKKEKLMSILNDFPITLGSMTQVAESRQRRLNHYIDPGNNELRPEDEVDAEDCKTELFGVDADKVVNVKEEEFEHSRAHVRMKARQSHRHAAIQRGKHKGPLIRKA